MTPPFGHRTFALHTLIKATTVPTAWIRAIWLEILRDTAWSVARVAFSSRGQWCSRSGKFFRPRNGDALSSLDAMQFDHAWHPAKWSASRGRSARKKQE